MRRIRWANLAYYLLIFCCGLFSLLVGINGSGNWGTRVGWSLLALWFALAGLVLGMRLRADMRQADRGLPRP